MTICYYCPLSKNYYKVQMSSPEGDELFPSLRILYHGMSKLDIKAGILMGLGIH